MFWKKKTRLPILTFKGYEVHIRPPRPEEPPDAFVPPWMDRNLDTVVLVDGCEHRYSPGEVEGLYNKDGETLACNSKGIPYVFIKAVEDHEKNCAAG